MDELNRSNALDSSVPQKNGWVFTGEFDFYKVISIASKCITRIQSYNMHGQLNRASKILNRQIPILVACPPTRIVNFEFKPNSTNTLELYMDGGWQFSFLIHSGYIHNAATKVETSLKFDIQIIGMSTTIITINCSWK